MKQVRKTGICILWCSVLATATIIKTGTVLNIEVREHPEFSGMFTVSEDGTIDYPLLADENITDISTSELMNELTFRLAKHVDNPLVLISEVKKPKIIVTVLGHVQKPGPVLAHADVTVQEVIALAGGSVGSADFERVKIIPKSGGETSAEFFDMKEFMKEGHLKKMPPLHTGDKVILLGEERTKKVKMIGAVNKPGFYSLEGKMNIFELIYLAGGPAEKADLSKVRRFSKDGQATREQVVNVQQYIDQGKMDDVPFVDEGDIVIVYEKWFDWKTFLTILNNVLLFIVTVQSIRGAVEK